jgi:hypothetical protein
MKGSLSDHILYRFANIIELCTLADESGYSYDMPFIDYCRFVYSLSDAYRHEYVGAKETNISISFHLMLFL